MELIGLIAAILTTGAFIPQVYQTIKTKSVDSISLSMLLIALVGFVLWIIYGFIISSASILLSSGITGVLYAALLVCKLKYGKKKEKNTSDPN